MGAETRKNRTTLRALQSMLFESGKRPDTQHPIAHFAVAIDGTGSIDKGQTIFRRHTP